MLYCGYGLTLRQFVYMAIRRNLFSLIEEVAPYDVISTLLEGTINMINFLIEQDKYFLLILTVDSNEIKDTLPIPIKCQFPDVFLEDVTYFPLEREV